MNSDFVSVEHLLYHIVTFKRMYYHHLTESDKTRLRLWTFKLQDLEHVPQEKGHYVTCPFSLDDVTVSGPDTCSCSVPVVIHMKFDRMLKNYNVSLL